VEFGCLFFVFCSMPVFGNQKYVMEVYAGLMSEQNEATDQFLIISILAR
jgi:hypothetical protein